MQRNDNGKLEPLPETVEGVLGDLCDRLRDSAARAKMGEEMLGMVRETMKRGGDPELQAKLNAFEGEIGSDNLPKHISACMETVKLLEAMRLERLIHAAQGDPFGGMVNPIPGKRPRSDEAIIMPKPDSTGE